MIEKSIICTICPMGCCIAVKADGNSIVSVMGNECVRGEEYAKSEFVCPMRTLTSSVLITGSSEPLLPVRTEKPVPKAKIDECMAEIRALRVTAPVTMHQVIVSDLAGTGVNLIAACPRDKK